MRAITLSLVLAVLLPTFGQESLDWKSVGAELQAAVKSKATESEAFSRKIEQWLKGCGMTIVIAHPRENSVYLFPLIIASASDRELPQVLAKIPGAKSREDFVRLQVEKERVDAVPFDRIAWDSKQPEGSRRQRYRLFMGYCAKKPPIGRTQEEIEADLGPGGMAREGPGFSYDVGPDLGIGIDPIAVELLLKDGKVYEYRFRRH